MNRLNKNFEEHQELMSKTAKSEKMIHSKVTPKPREGKKAPQSPPSDAEDAPRIPWVHLDIAGSGWHKGGGYGFTDKGATGATVVVFLGIAMYMAFHALSFGPITWLVLSEIFPSNIRGKAMGLANLCFWVVTFCTVDSFPSLAMSVGESNVFFIYAAFSALSCLFDASGAFGDSSDFGASFEMGD